MIDNGENYSEIVQIELLAIGSVILSDNFNIELEIIPDVFLDRPFWQFGSGENSSDISRIIFWD